MILNSGWLSRGARRIYTNLLYRCAIMAIPLDTFEPGCDISVSTPAKPLARSLGHAQSWRVFHFPPALLGYP